MMKQMYEDNTWKLRKCKHKGNKRILKEGASVSGSLQHYTMHHTIRKDIKLKSYKKYFPVFSP